jgi:quercetin dioxygenase-like cupin family protein
VHVRFICLLFITFAMTAKSEPGASQTVCKIIEPDATDGVLVAPASHKILFEDPDIRVLDVTVLAHTREPWHTHARPAVMYIMTASNAKYMTPEDPNPEPSVPSVHFKPVVARLDHAEPLHAIENVGELTFHAIRVEFKHPRCSLVPTQPAIAPGSSDALLAASDYHTLLFDNSDVRVLDVHLPPHTREPIHTYPWPGVLYILQGAPSRYYASTVLDPPVQNPPPNFKAIPVPAEGLHSLENTGEITAHAIRFELKHATPVSH